MAGELPSLSRETDHLGTLRRQLAELTGTPSFVNELLQNADDAGATTCRFTIDEHSIRVWNDAEFSTCGELEEAICPSFLNGSHRCDFHSFKNLGSGDKQDRLGVTGAFGVGFTAVYQFTDNPELISADEHWIFDDTAQTNDRVKRSRVDGAVGTEFILPWAYDSSQMRKVLARPPVERQFPPTFADEVTQHMPLALLFLRNLRTVEVVHAGTTDRFTREQSGDCVEISGPFGSTLWKILVGDAEEHVRQLRSQDQSLKLSDRRTKVEIALTTSLSVGRLYATLPTDDRTGLPAHINASFFPRSDRKGVFFDTSGSESPDAQVKWNRSLLRTAAVTLAEHLEELSEVLGPEATWGLLQDAKSVADSATAKQVDPVFVSFFDFLKAEVAEARITPDMQGAMVASNEILTPLTEDVYECQRAVSELGLHVVSQSLRSLVMNARVPEYGVGNLTLDDAADALMVLGYAEYKAPDDLSALVRDESAYHPLLRLLAILLGQRPSADSETKLKALNILPSIDGCRDKAEWSVRCTERELQQLGSLLDGRLGVLDEEALERADASALTRLVPRVSPGSVLEAVEGEHDRLLDCLSQGSPTIATLLDFIADHREEAETCSEELAALPMFPCGTGFQPLSSLSLPGGFTDPLGIASIVDLEALGPHRDLLRQLGATELDLASYIERHIPAFFEPDELDTGVVDALRHLLAEHLGKIQDNTDAQELLARQPLIETNVGDLRSGPETYWPNDEVKTVLGNDAVMALQPPSASIASLYRYLGVQEHPLMADIVSRCAGLAAQAPTDGAVTTVGEIIRHLSVRVLAADGSITLQAITADLSGIPWLPGEGPPVQWQLPRQLDATFNRSVFETTGNFLALPLRLQQSTTDVLGALGVAASPSPEKVVGHLLNLSADDKPAAEAVYERLNQMASDPALQRLHAKRCLFLDGVGYVRFNEVFWGSQPFGARRHQLPVSMRRFAELLDSHGTQEAPTWSDGVDVLTEIGEDCATDELDDENRAVVQSSWRFLSDELESGRLDPSDLRQLVNTRCVLDGRGMLSAPSRTYFDNMPHISEHLRDLRHLLIRRPSDQWRAMEAAGVSNLTDVLTISIADLVEPVDADWLVDLIADRADSLRRLVEAREVGVRERLSRLIDTLEVTSADLVRVSIEVIDLGHVATNPTVEAVLVGDRLYVTAEGDDLPWSAIAREIERAIDPESEPGQLSFAIRMVLSARTAESAFKELNAIGIARVDEVPVVTPHEIDVAGIGAAGVEESSDDIEVAIEESAQPGSDDSEADSIDSDTETLRLPVQAGGTAQAGTRSTSTGESTEDSLAGLDGTRQSRSGSEGASVNQVKRRGGETVLRSYVRPDGEAEGEGLANDGAKATERGAVDAALEYERRHGRFPTEMPPLNPGFDIESRDADGKILRWIEVKGLASSWSKQPAELTRREYAEAVDRGADYYLYVVDDARSDNLRVLHVVNNPAGKIDRYLFDGGWAVVADDVWQELPPLPAVDLRLEDSDGSIPFYDPMTLDLDAAPDGYIEVTGDFPDGAFATQINNGVRGSDGFGRLIVVQPAEEDWPLDGEYVFVDLGALGRSLACGTRTYARWIEHEAEDGSQEVHLDLGPLGREPLTADECATIEILGLARLVRRP